MILPASGAFCALRAQEAVRSVEHSLAARVPALLTVREQTQPTFRPGAAVVSSSRIKVGSNARHDVLVRMDASDVNASAVFVRDVAGVFRRLESNRPVAVAMDVPAGVTTLQVAWRAEGVSAGGASPVISYVLVQSRGAEVSQVASSRARLLTRLSE